MKKNVKENRKTESIWDLEAPASGELNPVAVELFVRGLKGETPLVPQWAEGLTLPVTDMSEVFESYLNMLETVPGQRSVAAVRQRIRALLQPYDGGLVKLRDPPL
jgi:hypothetical protein